MVMVTSLSINLYTQTFRFTTFDQGLDGVDASADCLL